MWSEIGKTVRKAMGEWGAVARFTVCVLVLTFAVVAVLWVSALHSAVANIG
ncbi:hypothetical protein ACQP2U_42385 (plasmid) [Nocardia sp. CA-084685]|uniref:hypothetical protein n=1 Tax=Nocardia sp. CA-084685 TaxID=3239970 RepID=UPI003D993247